MTDGDPGERAATALAASASVSQLLTTACTQLTRRFAAERATISRTIGDLLVELNHHDVRDSAVPLELFLVTDYPLTQEVIEQSEPRTVLVGAPDADPAEAALLERRGFRALLMLPLRSRGQNWGLIEIWRAEAFSEAEAAAGAELAAAIGEHLGRLEQAS